MILQKKDPANKNITLQSKILFHKGLPAVKFEEEKTHLKLVRFTNPSKSSESENLSDLKPILSQKIKNSLLLTPGTMVTMTHMDKLASTDSFPSGGYVGQCGSRSGSIVDCCALLDQCCTEHQSPCSVVTANYASDLPWSHLDQWPSWRLSSLLPWGHCVHLKFKQ